MLVNHHIPANINRGKQLLLFVLMMTGRLRLLRNISRMVLATPLPKDIFGESAYAQCVERSKSLGQRKWSGRTEQYSDGGFVKRTECYAETI